MESINISQDDIIFEGDININGTFTCMGTAYIISDKLEWENLLKNNKSNILLNDDVKKYIVNDTFSTNGNVFIYKYNNLSILGTSNIMSTKSI
jgi:hypothetical protein